MATFRDTAWRLSPARLRTARAARMVYSFIGIPLDAIAEAASQAVRARFPDQCPEDALPYHGRDRGIVRGPREPAASYRARLLLWLAAWRGAGVGRAMLDQIAGYLTPNACRIRVWTQVGVVYTREADGSFSITRPATPWNWDADVSLWSRFWVIIYSLNGAPWSRDGTWGDGDVWGSDGTTWGSTASSDEVQSIRSIIGEWKPGPSVCEHVVVSFDDAAFALTDASPPLPDGLWGHWSKNVGGVQVPARDSRAIYWRGVS